MVVTLAFKRRNLPHWLVADHAYFVTIRLHDTLPADVLARLREKRAQREHDFPNDPDRRAEADRDDFMKIDRLLDAGHPNRDWLSRPTVARSFIDNLQWMEQRGWRIDAVTLMPTHADVVLRNTEGRNDRLLDDLTQFKRHTGRLANRALERHGRFWAREDFDHWCRDQESLERAMLYTIRNPVKAGLTSSWDQWPWTRVRASSFRTGSIPD